MLPVFIIPYLFWFVYVLGAIIYFGFRDPDEMARLGISLSCGMTVCLLICTLFPNGTDVRILSFSSVVSILICLSTVFLKQHSLIDVAGGIVLARVLEVAVYQGIPVSVPAKTARRKKVLA